MYLKGSKWSLQKRRKRTNPFRIIILLLLVGGALYINQVVVPTIPPLFIPTPTATRSAESYLTDAENLLQEGKTNQAIDAYKEAVLVDPNNIGIFITLSRLYIYNGDYESALESAENALLRNQNNSMAHALRGWALGLMEDTLQAENELTKAIELDPGNSAAYAYLAESLAVQVLAGTSSATTIEKAIEASHTAETLSPNSLETHRARGIVLEITSNYEEAAEEIEAAIAIDPSISELYVYLGRIYRYLELYDQAVEEFTQAKALNPTNPLPDAYISRVYLAVGDYTKAVQYAEQAVNTDPLDANLQGNLGTMYYHNGQYVNSIYHNNLAINGGELETGETVEPITMTHGRMSEYQQLYGLALAKTANCNEALLIVQTLQQNFPDDIYAQYNAEAIIEICSNFAENPPTATPQTEEEAETEETPEP